ncbi:MAG: Uma2 family endonuclease [Pyrinomonadaceae bacterium]|nr:Uma2 family endonuclease [Pyrinomonadaceae bacterium]
MSQNLAQTRQITTNFPINENLYQNCEEEITENYFPETVIIDGEEMGETTVHYGLISNFVKMLELFFVTRRDVLISANLNVYYDEENGRKFYAPDILVCFGIGNHPRKTFKLWDEGTFPQIIFEIASASTVEADLGKKYLDYANLGVEEYYLLDAERENLPAPLIAYHRQNGRLVSAKIENNRVFSPLLNLEIVDENDRFRLFDVAAKEFLKTPLELEYDYERLEMEKESLESENAELKARLAKYENGEL